jgi:hypothetical protein
VRKDEIPLIRNQALALEEIQVSIECDLTQGHNYFKLAQSVDLAIKIFGTIGQFLRQWLVVGWSTPPSGGDIQVLQLQSIAALPGFALVGKSRFMKNGIHKIS